MQEQDITMIDAVYTRDATHNCALDAIGMFDTFAAEFQSESSDNQTEADFGIGPVNYDIIYDKVQMFMEDEEDRIGEGRKMRAISPQSEISIPLSKIVEHEKSIGEDLMKFEATLLYNKEGNEDSFVGNLPAGHRVAIRLEIQERVYPISLFTLQKTNMHRRNIEKQALARNLIKLASPNRRILKEIATEISKRDVRVNMAEANDLGFAFWCQDGPEYNIAHDPEWWEGASTKSYEVMCLLSRYQWEYHFSQLVRTTLGALAEFDETARDPPNPRTSDEEMISPKKKKRKIVASSSI
uniref:Putative mating-type protein n=2 Tax=Rutstroemiaceae TaxID=110844 RepID=A0A0G2SKI2_9HELO|nr:putative mating-type protein [Rutstroemia cuniculi]AJW31354.1 putative mating-type protein [Rutstroemia cuniculi]AJW31363.1 putative mating-type protein [Clarireedia homoeocarpa]